jgi:hypothetical protein
MRITQIIFAVLFCIHCLKAVKSPFDISSPTGAVNGFIIQRISTTNSVTSSNLSVLSTIPADAATAISTSTTITVKFSQAVNSTTVTVSTSGTACTGNLQLSDDSFITCLPFTGNPSSTDNVSYTATPLTAVSLKVGTVYKIKVTTGVQDSSGKSLAANYISPTGFTTDTPCSGGNCTITASLGAGNLVAGGGHSITLPSGSVNAGKTLIIMAGTTNKTVLYDPSNATFTQGPNLSLNANTGSNSFIIPSGSNSGKILIMHGGGSANSTLYDPSTNTTSAGANSGTCVPNTDGANNFTINSGANAGKIEIVCATGVGSTITGLYDPSTNLFTAPFVLSGNASTGTNNFAITTGTNAGFTAVVLGGGGANINGFSPATTGFPFSTSLLSLVGIGSGNFTIATGAQSGKTLVYVGGGASSVSNIFDPSVNAFSASANLSGNVGVGSSNFLLTSGTNKDKTLVIHGNTTNTTSLYNPSTNTFTAGPNLSSIVDTGGNSFASGSGIYPTARVIIHGNTTNNASIYFP